MNFKLCYSLVVLFFVTSFVSAQKSITGKVAGLTGGELPGVTILIKGTKKGTTTDFDGNYQIQVQGNNDVLVFSYLGFATKEVVVGNKSTINVLLEEDIASLDEVVVVGYGTSKKSDVTGTISSIKSEKLSETRAPSFVESIQGRMSGVQVVSGSGAPGSEIDIQIRGAVSINSSSKPLYVIDGVQIDPNESTVANSAVVGDDSNSPLAFINPADIETIDVLKSTSATAIYGNRGANGVVIVTTKGGKANEKARITFNAYTSMAQFPESRKIKMAGIGKYGDWYRFWKEPPAQGSENYFWDYTGSEPIAKDLSNEPFRDWQNELTDPSFIHNYNLGFSTSSEGSSMSGSISYTDQDGAIKNSDFSRLTARLKGEIKYSEKVRIGGNLNFSNSEANGISEGGSQGRWAGAIKSLVLFNPLDPEVSRNLEDEDVEAGAGLSRPAEYILDSERIINNSSILGNVYLINDFTENLNLKVTFGGRLSNSKLKEFYPSSINQGGGLNRGSINNTSINNWYNQNQLTYNKRFNKNHRINATVVFETRSLKRETVDAINADFAFEGLGVDDLGAGAQPSPPQSSNITNTNTGLLGRVNYFLKNGTYIFTGSLRADGSSKFPSNNRWGYFPSGSFAWNVSRERFLKSNSTISNLKLRLGYGVAGNDPLTPFQFLPSYGSNISVSNEELITTYKPAILGNLDLTWETTTEENIGIDLGLFNNKIALTADYYQRRTDDMLLQAVVPATTGFAVQWQNIGRIDSKGLELALSTNIITTSDFKWNASINATLQKTEIKSLGNGSHIDLDFPGPGDRIKGRIQVGGEIGEFYGFEFGGIFQYEHFEEFDGLTTEEAAEIFDRNQTYTVKTDAEGNTVVPVFASQGYRPGDMYFKDQGTDGLIDELEDRTSLGSSNPEVFGGFSNGLKYKNFDLNMNFTYSIGNEIYNETRVWTEGAGGRSNLNVSEDYFDNAWKPTAPSDVFPSFDGVGKDKASSYYVEDGSYLKFQSLTLGYSLPNDITQKLKLNKLRIYFNANDIYIWTKYTGFTPEVRGPRQLIGLDRFNYPKPLTITGGIDIIF
ncbi:TonB-dependent receptor [Tamlana sp. 2201CG12-4]|uniref:SusC/RagA family TonB-linked outer membrane protein n=1 Tax=Tamlana sp. 2201CG12-4 TaxID=3112582 RepID=UPI002DBCEF50|nr:TonB-dependent receptor [Tamlana sp. 2201CG12-4]MEC3908646.1 TonB-dependent receptor [Tamlana sp. 2201CG12-4]